MSSSVGGLRVPQRVSQCQHVEHQSLQHAEWHRKQHKVTRRRGAAMFICTCKSPSNALVEELFETSTRDDLQNIRVTQESHLEIALLILSDIQSQIFVIAFLCCPISLFNCDGWFSVQCSNITSYDKHQMKFQAPCHSQSEERIGLNEWQRHKKNFSSELQSGVNFHANIFECEPENIRRMPGCLDAWMPGCIFWSKSSLL